MKNRSFDRVEELLFDMETNSGVYSISKTKIEADADIKRIKKNAKQKYRRWYTKICEMLHIPNDSSDVLMRAGFTEDGAQRLANLLYKSGNRDKDKRDIPLSDKDLFGRVINDNQYSRLFPDELFSSLEELKYQNQLIIDAVDCFIFLFHDIGGEYATYNGYQALEYPKRVKYNMTIDVLLHYLRELYYYDYTNSEMINMERDLSNDDKICLYRYADNVLKKGFDEILAVGKNMQIIKNEITREDVYSSFSSCNGEDIKQITEVIEKKMDIVDVIDDSECWKAVSRQYKNIVGKELECHIVVDFYAEVYDSLFHDGQTDAKSIFWKLIIPDELELHLGPSEAKPLRDSIYCLYEFLEKTIGDALHLPDKPTIPEISGEKLLNMAISHYNERRNKALQAPKSIEELFEYDKRKRSIN